MVNKWIELKRFKIWKINDCDVTNSKTLKKSLHI